ncbi:MAG: DNA-3-methyladenine glycosylase 2 family protein [Phreatobacter sp.]|uniref:DNA-3-methyladenine glycosylase family protein n=1 Tax=Phreatobacter sp. TaxID=1966341 RepID=UPI001A63DD44|nr:DNA-3-methyladenine glycosylase 2 family protein [Phreatobacter sp.]MBL8571820.1 DNA-3-methyladenine glycosylase 2 family protein [Phreatobacter sp.]
MPRLRLADDLRALADRDPHIAAEYERIGVPPDRTRPPGFAALLRIIVGQQVSTKAAASMWARLETALDGAVAAPRIAVLSAEELRGLGFSRQKAAYALDLARRVADGAFDFDRLARLRDEAAIAELVALKGIGTWSAEVYLLFAMRRADIFPAGDLALQVAYQRLKGLRQRPSSERLRRLVEPWRPHRGAGAHFLWHLYANPPLG